MELHDLPKPQDLMNINLNKPPETGWMDNPAVFRDGTYSYPAAGKNLKILGLANPRQWSPTDEDWKLPENWQEIILQGMNGSKNTGPSDYSWISVFDVAHVLTNAIFSSDRVIQKICRSFVRNSSVACIETILPYLAKCLGVLVEVAN